MGRDDDEQVALGVADLLATLGPPGRPALDRMLVRDDDVRRVLRIAADKYQTCGDR
jgi:hypothetical protein